MSKQKFNVTGMTCASCAARVQKSVEEVKGVSSVNVNLLTNSMTVELDENITGTQEIINAVEKGGYNANIEGYKSQKTTHDDIYNQEMKLIRKRLLVSVIFLLPLLYLSMGHMFAFPMPNFLIGTQNAVSFSFLQFLLVIPIVFLNRNFFIVGFKQLYKFSPNMDSLIAIGSSAALLYGIFAIFKIGNGFAAGNETMIHQYVKDLYFESAGTILTLITLGKYLETKAKRKTSNSITKLIELKPNTATIKKGETEIEIPVDNVVIGDIVVVKAGGIIPVDGIIVSGNCYVDEAAITGESIPVFKQEGDTVTGATILKSGYIELRTEKVGNDTVLSKIIQLVEEASSSKAPISKLADKISCFFVPIVIIIACITTVVWLIMGQSFEFAMSMGISVLVISCPCALGLATPTAIMVGTGMGAKNGILIKSAEILENAGKINTIVLDKTGTITEGKPQVIDIINSENISQNDLLQIAASIEKNSEHPLSSAIVNEANKLGINLLKSNNYVTFPGKGIKAALKSEEYYIGNLSFMKEQNINTSTFETKADELAKKGKTVIFCADSKNVLGIITIADTIKANSIQGIRKLQEMGMKIIMLTGDHKVTAEAIKNQIGNIETIAEVLPQDKESIIAQLMQKGEKVAMVGDGINDAPALARANVGVAIGAGTDIAIEAADIVLVRNDITDVAAMIKLSKAVMKNIKENLFWALIYNTIGIPLAAGVFYSLLEWKLNPMFAAAAMSFSSVSVVLNALRLRFFKFSKEYDNKINTIEATNLQKNTTNNNINMKKRILIEGMSCTHCSNRIEKELNNIEGVTAKVDLETKTATVTLTKEINDNILIDTITKAGYTVVKIM